MTSRTELSRKNIALSLGFIFFLYHAKAISLVSSAPTIFDVTKFGAKGDGKPEYNEDGESTIGMAFIQAWSKACNSIGASTVLIPKGTFAVAQVLFTGPCQSTVTVELQGNIIADPDVSQFPNNELIVFQDVEGAKLVGTGSIDANRPLSMITALDPEKPFIYMDVMPSISLLSVKKFAMSGIKSMNPVAFHVLVDSSHEVSITNVNFEAINMRPTAHSDAIFITMSTSVAVTNCQIKTGDACVTVSGGSKVGQISDLTFEDLVLENVHQAITVKQDYLPTPDKPHRAKLSNVHFKNIKGTFIGNTGVSFACSKNVPCDGIELDNIDIKYTGMVAIGPLSHRFGSCVNAKVSFIGKPADVLKCT
ncbi:hypothetical protein KSS87_014654 [Heliosperma pusillum]|nr:hypothetical protein KSS87_014654 [Heliosperma pusillum]